MGEVTVSFRGTFTHSLDSKGRLTIPARMREDLEAGLVLTRGYGPYLIIYPQHFWDEQERLLKSLPWSSDERQIYTRWTFGGAADVSLDTLGRILIPDHLREWADLEDRATIVGAQEAIEIWSPERHEAVLTGDQEKLPDILRSLSAKGLF